MDINTTMHIQPGPGNEASSWFNLKLSKLYRNKSVLLILLWQFSTGLLYNIFLRPTRYIQNAYIDDALLMSLFISFMFMFSPLTGFIADVKLSRIRVLRYGTVFMLVSLVTILVAGSFLLLGTYEFNAKGIILVSAIALSLTFYTLGTVLFLSNILQFGTDQLRDAPTRYSTYFIWAYFWTDSMGYLITSATYLPGREIVINLHENKIAIDKYRGIAIGIIILISIIIISILLLQVRNYYNWFLSDNNLQNPYSLVYNILHYAVLHKKPVRPSAFTFCDNERPSRIDFGKQRYGGPFTTEQVEDVKVTLNILVALLSFSPIFLLEATAAFSFKNHVMYLDSHFQVDDPFLTTVIDSVAIIPTSILVCIPLFQCVAKVIPIKYTPNIFKKIGMAFSVLIFQLLIFLLYNTLSYDSSVNLAFFFSYCKHNATYNINKNFVIIPSKYVSILQQILFAVFQVLLYTSVYEFICCQSPQYMKGLLFGLFYALRAFNQSLGAATMYLFIRHWYSTSLSCGSAYYIFTLCIAVVSLLVYINVARKYKYRKRDDICNIYKFAEDYYSNIQ